MSIWKRSHLFLANFIILIGLLPFHAQAENDEEIRVAVDIAPLYSLVAQVMEGVGSPDIIISPNASPHDYNLKPSEAQILQDADIVFFMGEALTAWLMRPIENLSPNSQKIALLNHPETILWERRDHAIFEDNHEEGHNHEHETIDPHAWLSLENAAIWVRIIANELSKIDPANAQNYQKNAAISEERLSELKDKIDKEIRPIENHRFVVFHDSFQYFERDFDIKAQGAILLSDATPPSPARLTELQDFIESENISCILTEPQFNPNLINSLTKAKNIRSETLDPLGSGFALDSAQYFQLMQSIATNLSLCLTALE